MPELLTSDQLKKKIPKSLWEILEKAPLGWGIVALSDYRNKRRSIKQIKDDFKRSKHG